MRNLGSRWKDFLGVLFDPWSIVFAFATIVFIFVSSNQTDKALIAAFSVISSCFAAVLGSVWVQRWLEITEGRILVVRGNLSIRNLRSILLSVDRLEKRVSGYLKRSAVDGQEQGAGVERAHLEWIVGDCVGIEESLVNSIESWTDVIPEADVMTQIGIISALRLEVETLSQQRNEIAKERDDLTTELTETKTLSSAETEKLKRLAAKKDSELAAKERELREAKDKLQQRQQSIDTSLLGGISSTAAVGWPDPRRIPAGYQPIHGAMDAPFNIQTLHFCKICGKDYFVSAQETSPWPGRCPECAKK